MSKCFVPWPTISREECISDWLASLPTTRTATATAIPIHQRQTNRGRKRAMPPTTPPLTSDGERSAKRQRQQSVQRGGQRTRRSGDLHEQVATTEQTTAEQTTAEQTTAEQTPAKQTTAEQTTPRPLRAIPIHSQYPSLSTASSISQRSTRKKPPTLESLEIPVSLHSLMHPKDAKEKLPADILPLYTAIRSAAFHHKAFIPSEVRQEIKGIFGEDAQEYWFQDYTDRTAARRKALAELETLQSLLSIADTSQELGRYEDAWNAMVHLPLMQLALGDQRHKFEVRAELVTSATITVDSIPRLGVLGKRTVSESEESVLAVSVEPSSSSETERLRPGSKKVDLVIVLVPTPSSPLYNAIHYARQWGSVNQSTYGPLRENPIACSIETKTKAANGDAMVQLGVWTVAWYRKMNALWCTIHGQDTTTRRPMVSLPVITVVSHTWSIHFAVDRGHRIEMFGPVYMGSTSQLDAIYMLRASLALVRDWIETVFYDFLKQWFGCKEKGFDV